MSPRNVVLTGLVMLVLSKGVEAKWCYDNNGFRYRCSGLSNAARIGISIAIAVVALLLLLFLSLYYRRRRLARNRAYIPSQEQYNQNMAGAPNSYGPHPGGYNNSQSYQPTGNGAGYWNGHPQGAGTVGGGRNADGPTYPSATYQQGNYPPANDESTPAPPPYNPKSGRYAPPPGSPPS